MLEQGVVLSEQIGASFEDMNEWLQEVEDELAVQPPVTTATPPQQLAQQQQHNMVRGGGRDDDSRGDMADDVIIT